MNVTQVIKNPFGITVFGSSVVRVDPDIASLEFAVARLEKVPKIAFRKAREEARSVQSYLSDAKIKEYGSSRISLSESRRFMSGENRLEGYIAKIAFHVLLNDLDRVEEIISGVVEAGVNEISSIDFQTSRLKEIRVEARQRSVEAAQEKAQIYCQAAGVELGAVIHLEDVNPDRLSFSGEGHVTRQLQPDDGGPLRAFDPSSIVVGGAVLVAFEIKK
ncbi:MAG: SIMPL domain-containing protein [Chloroflexi bacterium]|nr:SIMPL domain-containing protein [Chloroflexota bacterium]